MTTISSRVMISSIDDGTTLHAQLLSDAPLVQAYSTQGAVPDWSNGGPTVYVDLMSGTGKISATSGQWSYQNMVLTFNPTTHLSTNTGYEGWFKEITNYTPTGYTSPVPAMQIMVNLATSENVSTTTIAFSGTYSVGNAGNIAFAVQTNVRITGKISAGIWGYVDFVGDADGNRITQDGQIKTMRAVLYGADGGEIVANATSPNKFTTAWYLNDVSIGSGTTQVAADGVTYYQAMKVAEDASLGSTKQVEDNAIIKCVFSYTKDGNTLTYTAYEEVCDDTDSEQIMTRVIIGDGSGTGSTGGDSSLRTGQTAIVRAWVAPNSQLEGRDTTWQYFYVKLHNGTSDEPILTSVSGFNAVISSTKTDPMYGYRPINYDSTQDHEWAAFSVDFNTVKTTFSKNFTAYIKASQSNLNPNP